MFDNADVIVVGSGFFGATIANKCAVRGKRVVVLDKRKQIGGNCHSEREEKTGIEVHKYGTHLFHTSNKYVWEYVNSFTPFNDYQHTVYSVTQGKIYPLPINMGTICQFFNRQMSPGEARQLIQEQARDCSVGEPRSLESKAISLIGRPLYEAFIKGYTEKQWQTDPKLLPPEIITRLPVRYTFDNRYFSDKFEGLPRDGYAALFRTMLSHQNIRFHTNVDYFDVRANLPINALIVYTGAIDEFYNYRLGQLGWRTIDLDFEVLQTGDFQGTSVVNYADSDIGFTRIHEFRHLHPERSYPSDQTVIAREYSRAAVKGDEPYYPINTAKDAQTYLKYRELARLDRNVIFGGRLGTYRYLDMHQAIAAAIKTFDDRIVPYFEDTSAFANQTGSMAETT